MYLQPVSMIILVFRLFSLTVIELSALLNDISLLLIITRAFIKPCSYAVKFVRVLLCCWYYQNVTLLL